MNTLLGVVAVVLVVVIFAAIGWALAEHHRHAKPKPNGWKQPRPLPFEPDAAMRAAAMSVRVPTQRPHLANLVETEDA